MSVWMFHIPSQDTQDRSNAENILTWVQTVKFDLIFNTRVLYQGQPHLYTADIPLFDARVNLFGLDHKRVYRALPPY